MIDIDEEKRLLNKLESLKLAEEEEEITIELPAEEKELLIQIAQWGPSSAYKEYELKSLLQKYFNVKTRIREKKAAIEEINELLRVFNEEIPGNELKEKAE